MKEDCGCWDKYMKKVQEFLLVLVLLVLIGMGCAGIGFFAMLTLRLIVGF